MFLRSRVVKSGTAGPGHRVVVRLGHFREIMSGRVCKSVPGQVSASTLVARFGRFNVRPCSLDNMK